MPSNGGNITFGINFNVDKSGLDNLKKSLQDIQKTTAKDLVGNLSSDQAKKALREAKQSASQIEQALKKAYNPTLNTTNISKFNQELKNSGTNLNQVYQRFSKIGITGQTAFTNLASNILTTNVKLRQTNSLLDSMGKTMINTVKWGIASSVMNTFTGSVQNAFNYVKALDSSLTDIRIVTGDSRDQMDRFAKSANQAAQSLGRQTKEYTNAALAFYQQGLGDEEVAARTETTLKAANITGADVASMADQLTAVWNGFQIQGEKTNEVVSKLAAVADTSASNMSELATAMSKSASIANNMGVNVDQLGAQIATIIATTRQAPQTVGNALKTIYARINDIKAGTDQAEVSLGNYTGKMAQLGINVLDQNGQLRDTGQVMEEIGQRWGTMTKEQQVYLAQTMAGQRQMNNLIALFDNWDMYTKELNISLEAQGTLDQKNARYMESLAAHTKEFEAAEEGLIQSFADSDSFKGFVDLGTEAIRMMTSLVEGIGGGGNAILALGSIATSVFSGVISKEINSLVTNFQNAKFNAEQLNQVIANTKSVAAIEGISDNTAVQAMIDAQTETQKYYSVMSEAEINHQNELIKELGLAEQNRANWEANTKAAQDYASQISGIKNIKLFDDSIKNTENLNLLSGSLDLLEEDLQTAKESFKDFRRVVNSKEDLAKPFDELKSALLEVKAASGATDKELQTFENQLKNIDVTNIKQIKKFLGQTDTYLQQTSSQVQNLNTVMKDGGASVQEFQGKVDTLNASLRENNASFAQAFNIQNIVQAVGAIGQVTSAITNLGRLPTIWNDKNLSSAEKFRQTILNVATALPMLIAGYQKLNSVLKIKESIQAISVLSSKKKLAAMAEDKILTEALTLAHKKHQMQSVKNVAALDNQQKAFLINRYAKQADIATTEKQIATNYALQSSLGIVVIALAAVAGVALAVSQGMQAARQRTIEANNATIEQAKAAHEQANANGQLYKSFSELKAQYDQGLITKEELYEADAYDIQGAAIANLTGQYDEFAAAAKNAREEQLKTQLQTGRNQISASTQNMIQSARKGTGSLIGNTYTWSPIVAEDSLQGQAMYGKTWEAFFGKGGEASLSADLTDPESIIDFYESLQKGISTAIELGQTGTTLYKEAKEKTQQMEADYQQTLQAYETVKNTILQLSASQSGIADAASEVDVQKAVDVFRQNLTEQVAKGALSSNTDIEGLITSYISKLNNDFVNQYLASKTVNQAKNIVDEVKDTFNNLSEEQKTILLTADVDLSKINGQNELKAILAEITAQKGYVEIPVQLVNNVKESLFEGKDISEKDFEGLQESFSPEIGAQLGDVDSFNNKTLREQLDLLRQVTQAQYEKNEAVLASLETQKEYGELANQDLERERQKLGETIQQLKRTREQLQNVSPNGASQSIRQLDSQIEKLQDQLQTLLEEDYSVDIEINADDNVLAKFNSEISDIVDNAVLLEKAASLIGEGFQVAASDIGALTSIFPEITQNAVTTADGIVQLDQGVVEQVLGGNSQILQSESQVARQRIQHKVDMLDAEIAYCDRRLAILQQVLDGEISEAQASEMLQQEKGQFAEEMANASGQAWVSAQEQGASSNAANTNVVIGNLDLIGQTANQVAAAVKAAMAGEEANYKGSGRKASSAAGTSFSDSQVAAYAGKNGTSMGQAADRMAKIQQQMKQIQAEKTSAEKLKNQYIEQMAKMADSTSNAIQKAGNAASGLGGNYDASKGGGGGGGGGKDKTKSAEEIDKLKLKDQDVDKYHQIERAIKRIDDYLDAMSGYEEKAIRGAKSDTIDKEVDALEQQKALYEQKIQMMKADLQLQQADLSLLGVQFDEQGNIINYTALMSAYQAQYNALLEQAKLLTGDAQENKLKEASNLKQQLESLKSQMGAYESLQDKIMDAGSAIRDIIDKEEELRIKQFKIKIDTELEFADAKRDWNEFKKEVIDKIKDDDFLGQARARVQDFFSYYDDQGNGIIQKLTEHVNRTREEAEIIENGGTSSIYGKNQAQALEDLKHYTDELMQNLKDVQEIAEDIHDLYLDTIDKAQDAFDEQIDQYEQIDGIIEHDMNLLELLSPENNEEALAHYYDKRAQNHNQEIDFYRKEADMWKAQLENAEEGTEEWKKFRDNWEASINDLNSAVESAVENLLDKYNNTISKIIKDAKNQIVGGDWQKAMDEWDRAKWNDDRYLDMSSRATGVLDFMDKVNEAMNGQSPKVQKQLNEFLEKEVGYLNEIPNLRQIDLDIAYKKLEVLQKQMALEDAQEAKTRMRLRRDSQGNYTYQYVADEDQIATKQQQLRDTLEELRQLAKVDISDTMDEVQEKLDEFFEHAQELSQTYYDDQDLLQQKLLELQTAYFGEEGYITKLGIDYNTMQNELLTATGAQFSVLLGQMGNDLQAFLGLDGENASDQAVWTSILALLSPDGGKIPTLFDAFVKDVYLKNFALMSEQNQNLLFGSETGLNPSWNTAIGNMAENYMALTRDVVIPCMQAMIDANAVYANDLNILQQVAGVSFGTIAQGIDADIAYTQGLIQANDALVDTYNAQMNAIAGVCAQIANLCAQYSMAEQAAIDAANAALKFWFAANGQTIGDYYSGGTPHATAAAPASAPVSSGTSSGGSGGSAPRNSGGGVSAGGGQYFMVKGAGGEATFYEYKGDGNFNASTSKQVDASVAMNGSIVDRNAYAAGNYSQVGGMNSSIYQSKSSGGSGDTSGRYEYDPTHTYKKRISGIQRYATGGYTGDWSNGEGRLALLDQKELVLNAEDTVNMLNAVKIASGMMERIAGLNSSVLDNLVANRGLSNIETGGTVDSSSHQVINIQADFPNANSADEIKQAFNNLINIASQRASGNRRTY